MLQELHIQSNLPLIILAISFICVVVIGFLEFKKVSLRLDELTTQLHGLSSQQAVNIEDNKKDEYVQEKKINKKKSEDKATEHPRMSQDRDAFIMENMMKGDAEILLGMPHTGMPHTGMPPTGIPPGLASMIIGGPMMPMGEIHVQNMYEEDIGGELDIQEENISEIDEDNLSEIGGELEEDIEKEDIEDKKSEYGSSSEESEEESGEESGEESEEESEEESDGELVEVAKGKVEEIKDVDRSSSIRELKDICQKLGLSSSGNKETLIKRINSKK